MLDQETQQTALKTRELLQAGDQALEFALLGKGQPSPPVSYLILRLRRHLPLSGRHSAPALPAAPRMSASLCTISARRCAMASTSFCASAGRKPARIRPLGLPFQCDLAHARLLNRERGSRKQGRHFGQCDPREGDSEFAQEVHLLLQIGNQRIPFRDLLRQALRACSCSASAPSMTATRCLSAASPANSWDWASARSCRSSTSTDSSTWRSVIGPPPQRSGLRRHGWSPAGAPAPHDDVCRHSSGRDSSSYMTMADPFRSRETISLTCLGWTGEQLRVDLQVVWIPTLWRTKISD